MGSPNFVNHVFLYKKLEFLSSVYTCKWLLSIYRREKLQFFVQKYMVHKIWTEWELFWTLSQFNCLLQYILVNGYLAYTEERNSNFLYKNTWFTQFGLSGNFFGHSPNSTVYFNIYL